MNPQENNPAGFLLSRVERRQTLKNHQSRKEKQTMKNYLVIVSANLPYPVEKDYREKASNIGTAVNRGIKKYLKDAHGKKIKQLTIKVMQL